MKSWWKLMIFFLWLTGISGMCLGNSNFSNSQNPFYYENTEKIVGNNQDTNYWALITTDAVKQDDGLLTKIMQVLKLDINNKYKGPQKAFYYIKSILNYALAFVSFIAFMLLLYGFYMMLIGDGEKGRDKVKSTLKGIVIAIISMSLSWLIVSALFWIYENPAQKDSPTTQTQSRP